MSGLPGGRGVARLRWRRARLRAMALAARWLGPLVRWLFYVVSLDVVARDLDRPVPPAPARGLEVRRVDGPCPSWWADAMPADRRRVVGRRLADGDIAYVAVVDGAVAGSVWVTRRTKRDDGRLLVRLGPGEAYTYELATVEEYRHLGTAAAVMSAMLHDLQDEGCVRRVFCWVHRRNRRSQVLLRTVFGFAQVQRARRFELLRRWGGVVPHSLVPNAGPLSRSAVAAAAVVPIRKADARTVSPSP